MTDLKWKIKDILGFEVYDNKSNKLGLLSDVMTTGANDIWVIKSHEEELLIPALKSIVTEVNTIKLTTDLSAAVREW
jgi:16S rRNA processing protein RimM